MPSLQGLHRRGAMFITRIHAHFWPCLLARRDFYWYGSLEGCKGCSAASCCQFKSSMSCRCSTLGYPCRASLVLPAIPSYLDWRWPLSCLHSVMMVFSTQLAEGGDACPPIAHPLLLYYPRHSTNVTFVIRILSSSLTLVQYSLSAVALGMYLYGSSQSILGRSSLKYIWVPK